MNQKQRDFLFGGIAIFIVTVAFLLVCATMAGAAVITTGTWQPFPANVGAGSWDGPEGALSAHVDAGEELLSEGFALSDFDFSRVHYIGGLAGYHGTLTFDNSVFIYNNNGDGFISTSFDHSHQWLTRLLTEFGTRYRLNIEDLESGDFDMWDAQYEWVVGNLEDDTRHNRIPEPATCLLFGLALLASARRLRRESR